MRWSVTIPGHPVSWDRAYRTAKMPISRRGVPVLNEDMTPRLIHRPVLAPTAEIWKQNVQLLVQNAIPRRWQPSGQIRLLVELHLAEDMDDDNALKLARDAASRAIVDHLMRTGAEPKDARRRGDDMNFLVCTLSKEVVPLRDARVVLTFDDDISHPR